MINELDRVILTSDLPEEGLATGDVGAVVHVYRGGAGYEVEFVTLDGETVAVVTLKPDQIRPAARREIPHARRLEPAVR